VRHRLLGRITGDDPFAGLLSTTQAEMPKRNEPVGQNCECLLASSTNPPPNLHMLVTVIVRLPKPPAVTDDRRGLTNWAPPR
jgi:hypothetical protein